MDLQKVITIHGEAFIDLKEIIGIMPNISRDSFSYILLRCGERVYFENYHLNELKKKLK